HADDRQAAVVLLRFVVERLFLDLAALIHGLHGAEHAAALGEGFELAVYRLLHEIRQVVDRERSLPGILRLIEPELAVDDELYRDRTAHALLSRSGQRLVIGVGMEAVA